MNEVIALNSSRRGSLPPLVKGKINGYLIMKVDKMIWHVKSQCNIYVSVCWWGCKEPVTFIPLDVDALNVSPPEETTYIFNIVTNLKLFETYINDCEKLNIVVYDKVHNMCIGSLVIANLALIITQNPYQSYHHVLGTNGNIIADLHVSFNLKLFSSAYESSTETIQRTYIAQSEKSNKSKTARENLTVKLNIVEPKHFQSKHFNSPNSNTLRERESFDSISSINMKQKPLLSHENVKSVSNKSIVELLEKSHIVRENMTQLWHCLGSQMHACQKTTSTYQTPALESSKTSEAKMMHYLLGKDMNESEEAAALETLKNFSPVASLMKIADDLSNEINSFEEVCKNDDKKKNEVQDEKSIVTADHENQDIRSYLKELKERNNNVKKLDSIRDKGDNCNTSKKENCNSMKKENILKQIKFLRVSVETLTLNYVGLQRVVVACRDLSRIHSCHYSTQLPPGATYFVEYEIPFSILKHSFDRASNISKRPWIPKMHRFCSKQHVGKCIHFHQNMIHILASSKGGFGAEISNSYITFRVYSRYLNQRLPALLGEALFSLADLVDTESLSRTQELSIVPQKSTSRYALSLGILKIIVEFGINRTTFGPNALRKILPTINSSKSGSETDNEDNDNSNDDCEKECKSPTTLASKSVMWSGFQKETKIHTQFDEVLPKIKNNRELQKEKDKKATQIDVILPNVSEDSQDKKVLLLGLLHVTRGRDLPVTNSHLICHAFWKDDVMKSDICWNTDSPYYNFHEVIPVLLTLDLLDRCYNNIMVIEVWSESSLLGVAKLPLHQFYIAYRDPAVVEQLLQSKYPIIGVDGWINIIDPLTRQPVGQLSVILALGTESQIHILELARGMKDVLSRSAIPPVSASVQQQSSDTRFTDKEMSVMAVESLTSKEAQRDLCSKYSKSSVSQNHCPLNVDVKRNNSIVYEETSSVSNDSLTADSSIKLIADVKQLYEEERKNEDISENSAERSFHEVYLSHKYLDTLDDSSVNPQIRKVSLPCILHSNIHSLPKSSNAYHYNTVVSHDFNTMQRKINSKFTEVCAENVALHSLERYSTKFNSRNKGNDDMSKYSDCISSSLDISEQSDEDYTDLQKNNMLRNEKYTSETTRNNTNLSSCFVLQEQHNKKVVQDDQELGSDNIQDLVQELNLEQDDIGILNEHSNLQGDDRINSAEDQENAKIKNEMAEHSSDMIEYHLTTATNKYNELKNTLPSQISHLKMAHTVELYSKSSDSDPINTENASTQTDSENRTLFHARIQIISAMHLAKVDNTFPNCYVTLCDGHNKILGTHAVDGANPLWSWSCEIMLPIILLTNNDKRLIFKVWHKKNRNSLNPNPIEDLIFGFVALDLSVLLLGLPWITGWFNINDFSGQSKGQIRIAVIPLQDIVMFHSKQTNVYKLGNKDSKSNLTKEGSGHDVGLVLAECHQQLEVVTCDVDVSCQKQKSKQKKMYNGKENISTQFSSIHLGTLLSQPSTLIFCNYSYNIADTEHCKTNKANKFEITSEEISSLSSEYLSKTLQKKLLELDEIINQFKKRVWPTPSEQSSFNPWLNAEPMNRYGQQQNEQEEAKTISKVDQYVELGPSTSVQKAPLSGYKKEKVMMLPLSSISYSIGVSSSQFLSASLSHSPAVQIHLESISHDTSNTYEVNQKNTIQNYSEGNMYFKENCSTSSDSTSRSNYITSEAENIMYTALNKLEIENVFNPLLFRHILYTYTNDLQNSTTSRNEIEASEECNVVYFKHPSNIKQPASSNNQDVKPLSISSPKKYFNRFHEIKAVDERNITNMQKYQYSVESMVEEIGIIDGTKEQCIDVNLISYLKSKPEYCSHNSAKSVCLSSDSTSTVSEIPLKEITEVKKFCQNKVCCMNTSQNHQPENSSHRIYELDRSIPLGMSSDDTLVTLGDVADKNERNMLDRSDIASNIDPLLNIFTSSSSSEESVSVVQKQSPDGGSLPEQNHKAILEKGVINSNFYNRRPDHKHPKCKIKKDFSDFPTQLLETDINKLLTIFHLKNL